jgi:hypothetical protein
MAKTKEEHFLLGGKYPLIKYTVPHSPLVSPANNQQSIRLFTPDWNYNYQTDPFIISELFLETCNKKMNKTKEELLYMSFYVHLYFFANGVPEHLTRRLNFKEYKYQKKYSYKDISLNKIIGEYARVEKGANSSRELFKRYMKFISEILDPLDSLLSLSNDELINKAIYKSIPKNPLSTSAMDEFRKSLFTDIIIMMEEFDREGNKLNVESFERIKKLLKEDAVFIFLRKDDELEKILTELSTIRNEITYNLIKEKIENFEQLKNDYQKSKNSTIVNQLDKIIVHLDTCSKKTKKHSTEIQQFIKKVTEVRNLKGNELFKSIDKIVDLFIDKKPAFEYLIYKSEAKVREAMRSYSRAIYDDLCKHENLTSAEKRFFILYNIGSNCTGRRIPHFDRMLFEFMNFAAFIPDIFIESVLCKNKYFKKINIADLLEACYLSYLRFVPSWHIIINENDQFKKQDKKERSITKSFEDFDPDQIIFRDNIESKIEINSKLFSEDYLIKKIESILTEREFEVLILSKLKKNSQKELASKLKVSPAYISKVLKSTKKKIKKSGIFD